MKTSKREWGVSVVLGAQWRLFLWALREVVFILYIRLKLLAHFYKKIFFENIKYACS